MVAPWRGEAVTASEPLTHLLHGLCLMDQLVHDGADLRTVLSRSALAFGCTLAVRSAGELVAAGPDGSSLNLATAPAGACRQQLPDGREVWLIVEGQLVPPAVGAPGLAEHSPTAAEVVLRRLAVVVAATAPEQPSADRAEDLRVVVDPALSEGVRQVALRRMGLNENSLVVALALHGPPAEVHDVVSQVRRRAGVAHHALFGRVHLVLTGASDAVAELTLPSGVRGAFTAPAAARLAPESWRTARIALRFALPGAPAGPQTPASSVLVDASQIGGWVVLAEHLPAEALAEVADVGQLHLLVQEAGADMVSTLVAVASTDSLRSAARVVHLHHNSVAHRVARAEKVLGFPCTQPYGRARLLLALTLHRLLESHQLF